MATSAFPVFYNGGWTTQLPDGVPYYIDPYHNLHIGQDQGNGNAWFAPITNERNGTADLGYGWATESGQEIAGVTSPGTSDRIGNIDWIGSNVKEGVANGAGQMGWTVPTAEVGNIGNYMIQGSRDNGKYAVKDKGGLGGLLGSVLSIASLVPGLQFLAPVAAVVNGANALANGSLAGVLAAAFPYIPGSNAITNGLSSTYQGWGASADAANALTNATVASGITLGTGGNINDALTNGALTAGSTYAATGLRNLFAGDSAFPQDAGVGLKPVTNPTASLDDISKYGLTGSPQPDGLRSPTQVYGADGTLYNASLDSTGNLFLTNGLQPGNTNISDMLKNSGSLTGLTPEQFQTGLLTGQFKPTEFYGTVADQPSSKNDYTYTGPNQNIAKTADDVGNFDKMTKDALDSLNTDTSTTPATITLKDYNPITTVAGTTKPKSEISTTTTYPGASPTAGTKSETALSSVSASGSNQYPRYNTSRFPGFSSPLSSVRA